MNNIENKEIATNVKNLVEHYEKSCHIPCTVYAISEMESANINCPVWNENMNANHTSCIDNFIYNAKQAERFGGSYVFFCAGSLIYWVSPIITETKATHIILAGPARAVSIEEVEEDISENLEKAPDGLRSDLQSIPYLTPDEIHSMSEILRMCASWASGYQEQKILDSFQSLSDQSDLFAVINRIKEMDEDNLPLFDLDEEERLKRNIINKDIEAAEKSLTEILGRLFYINYNNQSGMKLRLQEIITIMSRATLKAGAIDTEVWNICETYYKNLFLIKTFEKISYDMHIILHKFFDLINTSNTNTYSPQIMRAIKYANKNFNQQISLTSAAEKAHLSVSYFCKEFQIETGFTWTQYLNKIRIKQAKKLLKTTENSMLEIAEATGFETQCYFSRTYKKFEGTTPSKYRKSQNTNYIKSEVEEIHDIN
ncbi:MAG: helix-turn-helix domain-containing protein [Sphaerochaeta sp.]